MRILPTLFSTLCMVPAFLAMTLACGSAPAAELMMVERTGCPYCARWQREIGPIYGKTEESAKAPLKVVQLEDGQPRVALSAPVRFTPTFLLIDGEREIGRITGYMNDESFWGLLDMLLNRLDKVAAAGDGQGVDH